MKKVFLLVVSVILFLMLSVLAYSGEITGRITYSDGSPCSSCNVSASTGSGVTDRVQCNREGRFRLTYPGSNSLGVVYVNGTTAQNNVANGSYLEFKTK